MSEQWVVEAWYFSDVLCDVGDGQVAVMDGINKFQFFIVRSFWVQVVKLHFRLANFCHSWMPVI